MNGNNDRRLLGRLIAFLIFLSGSDPEVLARRGMSSERNKAVSLGWIVLMVGCFSGAGMAKALSVSLHLLTPSIAGGLVWASFIIAFDRYMISSISGKLGARRVFSLAPRLVIAVVVSIVVTGPASLAILPDSVRVALDTSRTHADDVQNLKPSLDAAELNCEYIRKAILEREEKRTACSEGRCPMGCEPGIGPHYHVLTGEIDELKRDLANAEQERNRLEAKKNSLQAEVIVGVGSDRTDVLGQLRALWSLCWTRDTEASDPKFTRIVLLFIFLFFLAIELTPVIMKASSSVYDLVVADTHRAVIARSRHQVEAELRNLELEPFPAEPEAAEQDCGVGLKVVAGFAGGGGPPAAATPPLRSDSAPTSCSVAPDSDRAAERQGTSAEENPVAAPMEPPAEAPRSESGGVVRGPVEEPPVDSGETPRNGWEDRPAATSLVSNGEPRVGSRIDSSPVTAHLYRAFLGLKSGGLFGSVEGGRS